MAALRAMHRPNRLQNLLLARPLDGQIPAAPPRLIALRSGGQRSACRAPFPSNAIHNHRAFFAECRSVIPLELRLRERLYVQPALAPLEL
eukprot:5962572-Pyramimonas_sp.AAC.1